MILFEFRLYLGIIVHLDRKSRSTVATCHEYILVEGWPR